MGLLYTRKKASSVSSPGMADVSTVQNACRVRKPVPNTMARRGRRAVWKRLPLMSYSRRRARILAMQVLCEWDVQHDEAHDHTQALERLAREEAEDDRSAERLKHSADAAPGWPEGSPGRAASPAAGGSSGGAGFLFREGPACGSGAAKPSPAEPPGPGEFAEGSAAEAEMLAYARGLVSAYHAQRQRVDDRIAAAAEHWELPRMLPVDRNAMRVAVVEMLSGDAPAKVAIDEAIEIAREFGSEESARFVNGVLDLVYKRLERSEASGSKTGV